MVLKCNVLEVVFQGVCLLNDSYGTLKYLNNISVSMRVSSSLTRDGSRIEGKGVQIYNGFRFVIFIWVFL